MEKPKEKANPEISQHLLEEIKHQAPGIVDLGGVKIRTSPGVFPPKSSFSDSSENLHTVFGEVRGRSVLDIGTGTGVQAIQAAVAGAREVCATDINPLAIACARENVRLNGVEAVVTVIESDLFEKIPPGRTFDLIIANLPITDLPVEGVVEAALYDSGMKTHRRLFAEAGGRLSPGGVLVMTHADLLGRDDFTIFEDLLTRYGLRPDTYVETKDLGYTWRMYRIVAS